MSITTNITALITKSIVLSVINNENDENNILLEDGFDLLLESGGKLLLEE